MVIHHAFYWIEGFFILGAAGTFIANRSEVSKIRSERWLKLIIHFFIVHLLAMLIIFLPQYFIFAAFLILIIGLFEIIKHLKSQRRTIWYYVSTLLIYSLFSVGFYLMADEFTSNELLFIFLVVFVFDGFSQISGQIFGKHKLFPVVSPGKTVEGLVGGAVCAIINCYFIRDWVDITAIEVLPVSLLLISAAVAGDWLASYFKRKHKIKDFGKLIPGHGGILDRFDSWISAGAIVYFISLSGRITFGI